MENLKTKLGVILFSERRSKTARTSVVNELNSKILLILFLIYMITPLYNFFHKKEIVQGFLMYNEFAQKHYKGK